MLGFTSFLNKSVISEAVGRTGQDAADTAYSGHANEHFTHHLITQYANHLDTHMNNGHDYETAHKKALEHMHSLSYDHNHFSKMPELQKSSETLGHEKMNLIHEDSKKTAEGIINHLKDNYDSSIRKSYHTGGAGGSKTEKIAGEGKKSEADLLFETRNKQGLQDHARAYLDHVGASLKYSKKTSSKIKVHSPSIGKMAQIIAEHHKKMHGEDSDIHENLNKIGSEGLQAQREALLKHHDTLNEYFSKLGDKKLSYKPVTNEKGEVIGGNLSQDAVSHLRDSKDPKLRAAYNDMAKENLKMKTRMAEAFKNAADKVTEHPSTNSAHDDIKESLIRSMGNLPKDKLPTFLVSTERAKPKASIYDVSEFIKNDIAKNGVSGRNSYSGKSTFKVGPLDFGLDARPSTSANPLTTWPINTDVKTSSIRELRGDVPNKPKAKKNKKTNEKSEEELPSGEFHGKSFRGPSE